MLFTLLSSYVRTFVVLTDFLSFPLGLATPESPWAWEVEAEFRLYVRVWVFVKPYGDSVTGRRRLPKLSSVIRKLLRAKRLVSFVVLVINAAAGVRP